MANQEYKLIDLPKMEIGEYVYVCETYNMNLENFLKANAGKKLYIYQPSILTNKIKAIVI